jgi:RNA polymerase sigma factor (sigma-70 family)
MSPAISNRLLATQSDERLLALVGNGHERAFETLVKRYRNPLLRYCRRIGLSDSCAEEAVQHALLEAWLAIAGGTEVRDLRPWLYRIVHNRALNAMRSGSEEHLTGDDTLDAATASRAAVGSDLDGSMAVRDALAEMAALPRMQREAIFLTAMDGQTHEEVASALGVTHGAVRGLLYRARTTLRAAAAAITPQPLLDWMSRGAGGPGPTAERIAELSSPAGVAGATGVLLKGAVAAVTAGVVLTGAAVGPLHGRVAHRPASAQSASATAGRPADGGSRNPLTVAREFSSVPVATHAPAGAGGARAGGPARKVPGRPRPGSRRTALHPPIGPAVGSEHNVSAGRQGAEPFSAGARRGASRERSDVNGAATQAAGLDSAGGPAGGARDASGDETSQAAAFSGGRHGGDRQSSPEHPEGPPPSGQGAVGGEPPEPAGGGDRVQRDESSRRSAEPQSANGN